MTPFSESLVDRLKEAHIRLIKEVDKIATESPKTRKEIISFLDSQTGFPFDERDELTQGILHEYIKYLKKIV